jgi:protein-S-isoprenylcysteine O-methyltransferase Ste14
LEFRQRFWFIAGIFFLGFFFYNLDHTNVSVALARLSLGGHPREDSAIFGAYVRGFFALGTLIVALAALVRTWAGAYLHSSIIHDAALHSDKLVADGPFRHLRNPLYLGTNLIAIGIGMLASRAGLLFMAVAMLLFTYRLIRREETTLLVSQGEGYRRYFTAVPRLIPSLLPRLPASGAKANWLDGFTGELFMWGGAAAMAVFTATENIVYFWIVLGSAFAIYFLQSFLRGRKRTAPAG